MTEENIATEAIQEMLNRYLDGDLSGEEAVRVAMMLAANAGMRDELERLRAVRAAIRGMNWGPSDRVAAETSRLRTLSRLRASVDRESWQQTRDDSRLQVLQSRLSRFWSSCLPVVTSFAAAATVVGVYLLLPQQASRAHADTVTMRNVRGTSAVAGQESSGGNSVVSLPGEEEMAFLLDLHDAHGSTYSGEEPLLHRSRVAEAQASLLKRADDAVAQHL